ALLALLLLIFLVLVLLVLLLILLLLLLLLLQGPQRQLEVAARVEVVGRELQRLAVGLDGAPVVLLLEERVAEVEARGGGETRGWVLAERSEQGRRLVELAVLVETVAEVEPSPGILGRSEEHTSELQSRGHLVCRLLLEKKSELKLENVDGKKLLTVKDPQG